MRWFIIYFVVHRCVDVCGGGGGGIVIVGFYCLLLLFFWILSSRWFTIYSYLNCRINSLIFKDLFFYVRELYHFNNIKHVLWYQLGFWHSPISQCEMKRKIQKKTVGREKEKIFIKYLVLAFSYLPFGIWLWNFCRALYHFILWLFNTISKPIHGYSIYNSLYICVVPSLQQI